jgi:hypothetical protein
MTARMTPAERFCTLDLVLEIVDIVLFYKRILTLLAGSRARHSTFQSVRSQNNQNHGRGGDH